GGGRVGRREPGRWRGPRGLARRHHFAGVAPAPSHTRASATTTACGPAPAGPSASTVFPATVIDPFQTSPSARVNVTFAPTGSALSASPFGGPTALFCSSWSLATQAGQRLPWNFASR